MLIGILQAGHAPAGLVPGDAGYSRLFQDLLAGHDFTFRTWNVVDMEFPDGPGDADGWLITGSRHGAYEDLPFIAPLEDLIRAIRENGRPLVGVCFGHQIIAQALGGMVEKYAGGWAVGRSDYNWQGSPLALNAWHQDQVTRLPDGATRLATSTFCENAALAYGDTIFTVQAHPEFDRDQLAALIETRGAAVEPDRLDRARALLDEPVDNDRLAAMIGRFFREGVAA
ncbi:type 1 glutamine amidotransferase [Wenxinia marina]|uniref:GMP synthase-Glutamine amidotransferase domain protein n=1 Tax=Wenxinia marina DSM 24838 TaxID=1123501 RepID=A0A0D0P9M4_9RHOB|nr:type 1 glutamine amidotransferase [Wenxinia marina]KIQ68206.1 GMP synthase - Glutamine amidotransferase domain protein [Wenxinia marina DSM 24838]GGL76727.1 glutamine amidotransferase [Wenxinia marina]